MTYLIVAVCVRRYHDGGSVSSLWRDNNHWSLTLLWRVASIGEFAMSYFSSNLVDKKLVSGSTVISSFVGVIMAVPLAFMLNASINNANALQPVDGSAVQANVDDFAKFAFAFNQGYEASAVSKTSGGGGQTCSEATVSAGGGAGAMQFNAAGSPAVLGASTGNGAWANGGGQADAAKKATAMVGSYYNYTSMVNNSNTVTNVNSNNTVGSHNSTQTDVNVEKSKGVYVAVSSETKATQKNANESFNTDSYNTTNDTKIVNDSFNKEVTNTKTITNTTDIDVNKETNVSKETNIEKTIDSHNRDNSINGDASGNTLETDVKVKLEGDLNVNSNNED